MRRLARKATSSPCPKGLAGPRNAASFAPDRRNTRIAAMLFDSRAGRSLRPIRQTSLPRSAQCPRGAPGGAGRRTPVPGLHLLHHAGRDLGRKACPGAGACCGPGVDPGLRCGDPAERRRTPGLRLPHLPHPPQGPKTEADAAMTYVNASDLTAEQNAVVDQVRTIIREKQVPVARPRQPTPGAGRVEGERRALAPLHDAPAHTVLALLQGPAAERGG